MEMELVGFRIECFTLCGMQKFCWQTLIATCKVHIVCQLCAPCDLWVFATKFKWKVFSFSTLSSYLLSSLFQVQLFGNASCVQCILWGENVSTIWSVNALCEVKAREVKGLFVRSKVKGLRFEVCLVKGQRLKEVGGLNFEHYLCEV
jgi:hypothetical protein